MNPEPSNISIINRNSGQVTGEAANALPVIIKTSFSWLKIFLLGVLTAFLILLLLFFTVKSQVQVVEIVGKSPNFQIYELK